MKYLLFFNNLIFCLLGLAALVGGIVIKVNSELVDKVVTHLFHQSFSNHLVAIILIVLGAFIMVVAFCGCWGACQENKCMLGMYAFIMIILILIKIVSAILLGVFWKKINSTVEDEMLNIIKHEAFNTTHNDKFLDEAISSLQATYKCCGFDNYADYKGSWWAQNTAYKVPYSCCALVKKDGLNLGNVTIADVKDISTCNDQADFVTVTTRDQSDLYVKGCFSKLIDALKSSVYIVIGIFIAIWFFEIFCVVFACYVRSAI